MEQIEKKCPWCESKNYFTNDQDFDDETGWQHCTCVACGKGFSIYFILVVDEIEKDEEEEEEDE